MTGLLRLDPATQFVTVVDETPTVSVLWDRAVQAAVVADAPGPTIAARAYALTHTAIFDAWAQYDPLAVASTIGDALQQDAAAITDANKAAAMSWAAFTVLNDLFPDEAAIFLDTMATLGLDPSAPVEPGSPADIGRQVGQALIAARASDGSNQAGGYADTIGYLPANPSPLEITDITRWTPENVPIDPEDGTPEQSYLTPHWGEVTPFALPDGAFLRPPPPEPFLVEGVEAVLDMGARTLTLADGTVLAVSRDLVGEVINPGFIAQAEEIVATSATLTDEQKLIAEFWEDAGATSYPPGTWMTFGQYASARDGRTLDEDAVLFMALGNAVMDAGIATWEAKLFYDYVRPVRAIRDLGELGLIGTEGTDELTGEQGFVIEAWAGPGEGTRTILAENWLSYQTPGLDPSPPFAEFTSGHSAFSAAGAEVLSRLVGEAFGGAVEFAPGASRFEPGLVPAETATLAWETFRDAADEAGLSRIYGGIHFEDGDFDGRALGAEAGRLALLDTLLLVNGVSGDIPRSGQVAPEGVQALARLYVCVLGRLPDRDGLGFWNGVLESGSLSLEEVAALFPASGEFGASFGGVDTFSPRAFLDRLALNAGIDADAVEIDDALVLDLEEGADPGQVVAAFAAAPEVAEETPWAAFLAEAGPGDWWFA